MKFKKQKGYTIFEVMIAVLVVSFGMISLGGLMLNSIKYSKESANRFVATQQLYEITDRMRANNKGVSAGYYDAITGIANATNCRTTSCNISDIAKFDAAEWNTKNSRVLPKGAGTVVKNGDSFLVTVEWSENQVGNATPVVNNIKLRITV